LAVVINEFEVTPEPRAPAAESARQPEGEAASTAMEPGLARELLRLIEKEKSRENRLRAY
jgi:hypothetical protein